MDFTKLAQHIADFFLGLYDLLEKIKAWATKASEDLGLKKD